jgi:hypothetical protein
LSLENRDIEFYRQDIIDGEVAPEELKQCVEDTCKLSSINYIEVQIVEHPNYRSNISAVRLTTPYAEYIDEIIYQVTTDIKFAENMKRETNEL